VLAVLLALVKYSPPASRRKRDVLTLGNSLVLGLRVLAAGCSSESAANILRRKLTEYRADCVCFEDGFPFRSVFSGFPPPRTDAVYDLFFGEIVRGILQRGSTAYFRGDGSERSRETLRETALAKRYVLTDSSAPGADSLAREFGASVITGADGRSLLRADCAVFLSEPQRETSFRPDCVCVASSPRFLDRVNAETKVLGLSVLLRRETPPGFARAELIGEAVSRGAVSRSDLTLTKILTTRNTL
jgi:hypothetical protein